MKVVDMELNHVVKSGVCWPYPDAPNCKRMIPRLERNEALITWLQPNDGRVEDQFPAIRVKDNFYTMSLRQMKVMVVSKVCILQK
jgi:hypothetical protein